MNRYRWLVALMIGAVVFTGMNGHAQAQSNPSDEVTASVTAAQQEVLKAREAIAKGKELVSLIPDDSPYLPEVTQMLKAAASNWKIAVVSLKGANESAQKVATASSDALAHDYALLARVNAYVAFSGAKVVQIGLAYIDAVASNKTEALDLIRSAMQDALAASSQVQFNCDRVKSLISEKYSN